MLNRNKVSIGLRAIAVYAAARGAVVLLLGCGVLRLLHKNLEEVAEELTEALHVNPGGKLSNLFLELASRTSDRTLWVLALGALVYAAVRCIEAYGLWHERDWAQWFELLSLTLYLAPELYWLLRHPTWFKWAVLVINLLIVVFLLTLRIRSASRPTVANR